MTFRKPELKQAQAEAWKDPLQCPECGAVMEADQVKDETCPHCGYRVGDKPQVSPADGSLPGR